MRGILPLAILLPGLAFGQSLVSTDSENRTVFLEDFTGVNCVWCPDGHLVMAEVAAAHPGLVSLVAVHAGPFANPGDGQLDLRTDWGTELDDFYDPTGYPMGLVNRHAFSNGTVLSRGQWPGAADEVLALPSPVNLGLESFFDSDSRELTVNVVLYYTADSPDGDDHLGVLITESHIIGYQSGGSSNYDHKHVLRGYLTPVWGDDVGAPAAGTTVERSYTFTVPEEWNIDHCEVTAFVAEYQSDVYQARTVQADGGTTLITGLLSLDAMPYRSGSASVPTDYNMSVANALGEAGSYTVTLTTEQAPAGWGSVLTVNGTGFNSGDTITIDDGAAAAIQVQVTPDATAGIGAYLLTVASVEHPLAPVLRQDLRVISGVHDLIISNAGAEPWEPLYIAAMDQSWETAYALTTQEDFIRFGAAGALGGVQNIYRNISWTFPSYTDAEVAVLIPFLEGGGNLMIAGQDIGWDQSGASSAYGTPVTRAFYTDYMFAEFVNDGEPSSFVVTVPPDDPVFGGLGGSLIAHVFGSNTYTYPDQIIPLAPAVPILIYGSPAGSIGGLRVETSTYKLVYFGIGPEQMYDEAVGRQLIQRSHNWFHGTVGVEELDAAFGMMGQPWPVPANEVLNIPMDGPVTGGIIEVFDATGRLADQQTVHGAGNGMLQVATGHLTTGLYSFRLRTGQWAGQARSFIVRH